MTLSLHAPGGVPEVGEGDDLSALLLTALAAEAHSEWRLRDGDVVVVTSKVVSKAEGRLRSGDREDSLAAETLRVVASRGGTTIVRNRLGLTMAAAGIDASNVPAGRHLLLPLDPDASARRVRTALAERAGVNVGVVVSDTAGRAWRVGQTDVAIGAAGVVVTEPYADRVDAHGNRLAVTEPAVADELAGAAELASGKLGGRPFVVVRGRADLVLPPGDHGPGATALIRPEGADLFGLGARQAVVEAAAGRDLTPFGEPVPASELVSVLQRTWRGARAEVIDEAPAEDRVVVRGVSREQIRAVVFAHGWEVEPTCADAPDAADGAVRLRKATGTP